MTKMRPLHALARPVFLARSVVKACVRKIGFWVQVVDDSSRSIYDLHVKLHESCCAIMGPKYCLEKPFSVPRSEGDSFSRFIDEWGLRSQVVD